VSNKPNLDVINEAVYGPKWRTKLNKTVVSDPNRNVSSSEEDSNQASTNDLKRNRKLLNNANTLFLSTDEDEGEDVGVFNSQYQIKKASRI
jgi:hypothetical protein